MKFSVLAVYWSAPEASLARKALAEDGIEATLRTEDEGGFQRILGAAGTRVELLVAERDLERAQDVLDSLEPAGDAIWDESEDDDEGAADELPQGRVVDADVVLAARSSSDNPYQSPAAADSLLPAPPRRIATGLGDAVAFRAWRAAIVGIFLLPIPVMTLYSGWLLLRVATSDAPVSAAGMKRLWGAVLVNAAVCGAIGIAIRALR